MIQTLSGQLEKFQNAVGVKFQLYNSLFLALPFYGIDKTGILLSLFGSNCEEGFAAGKSPTEIIDGFFADRSASDALDLLFRFVQYAERQVVLFDALEDAAFAEMNDLNGAGTLTQLESAVQQNDRLAEFKQKLAEFSVRLVLTAHPTQFYPGSVLGIINDLDAAITANDVTTINTLLQQLGRTPFFKKQKPTPYDEASSLIWYLENVFYNAIGAIASELRRSISDDAVNLADLMKMGFWSGGDRDGNPFVTSETTLQVSDALRRSILRCYHTDIRRLKRRLTFANVEAAVIDLEKLVYREAFQTSDARVRTGSSSDRVLAGASLTAEASLTKSDILAKLTTIRNDLVTGHNGLFVHLVDDLINKVEIFGLHFASLDIRQEASEHEKVWQEIGDASGEYDYGSLTDTEKIDRLLTASEYASPESLPNELSRDTLRTVAAVREIQQRNGEAGCHRYVISQCQSAVHVVEVIGLFLAGGWKLDELSVDIVPLFETITDLQHAPSIMRELYNLPAYREHLQRRGNRQTIMLGFSDGTKDGGYLMANWSIYKAKDELTRVSREFGINVVFFDGRGGPPARGGGKTHKFYSSMGQNVADEAIELTVQGQTVSSNFGTVASARYNIEQMLHAGIYNDIFAPKETTFSEREEYLMSHLAEHSFAAYDELKTHANFLEYLSAVSPLRFYAETNIGSRPSKRGIGKLMLKDLRAIPFVGAWSQIKQNVPGFYGVGSALEKMDANIDEITEMYHSNGFFKALIDNCEMAMQKTFMPLTSFLVGHVVYGEVWRKIRDEYDLTRRYLTQISGTKELMSDLPVEQQSVRTRERIVLPLLAIQQYALTKIRESEERGEAIESRSVYEKLVIRCSFGIINAGRNSA
ncbi:MAG: phosphoenolpyruvate carboxylase [Pyrinomonadaceae bacterium]